MEPRQRLRRFCLESSLKGQNLLLLEQILTLRAPITTAADKIHCLPEKIRLDVSSESSARPRIHMKNQAFFSSKDNSKKLKCRLLQFLFGAFIVD